MPKWDAGRQAGTSDKLRCPSNSIRSDVRGNRWGNRASKHGRKLSKGKWVSLSNGNGNSGDCRLWQ